MPAQQRFELLLQRLPAPPVVLTRTQEARKCQRDGSEHFTRYGSDMAIWLESMKMMLQEPRATGHRELRFRSHITNPGDPDISMSSRIDTKLQNYLQMKSHLDILPYAISSVSPISKLLTEI